MEERDGLSAWPQAELKALCRKAGLDVGGTKEELVRRLRHAVDVLSTIKQRESTQRESTSEDEPAVLAKDGTDITALVALVRDVTNEQKSSAAADALWNLAYNDDNQILIAKAGGIPPLVELVRDGTDVQKEEAAFALHRLAYNDDNQIAIAKAGGIPPLVALVRDGNAAQKLNAAQALGCLAYNDDNEVLIAKAKREAGI